MQEIEDPNYKKKKKKARQDEGDGGEGRHFRGALLIQAQLSSTATGCFFFFFLFFKQAKIACPSLPVCDAVAAAAVATRE